MSGTTFVYVIYIRSSAEKVWDALTKPEFTRFYWAETTQRSEWRPGASWAAYAPDGRLWDKGEIVEADRPRRLVLTWQNQHFAEMKAEGFTRLTYELALEGDVVRLTLTHAIEVENSKIIGATSQGWPMVLASLKSLLETGAPLSASTKWPQGL